MIVTPRNAVPIHSHFFRISVRARPDILEWAAAEAWEAGACGVEERESDGVSSLMIYVSSDQVASLESTLARFAEGGRAALAPAERVPDEDWVARFENTGRRIEISERLAVRGPHQRGHGDDLVIEARQAFGTGEHASTATALAALDRILAEQVIGSALDLGCGSGVLAIAARKLGVPLVFACDLDAQAARETAENGRRNGVHSGLLVFAGSLEAALFSPLDLLVANMIRREIDPMIPAIARCVQPGGFWLVAGLLERDRAPFLDRARAFNWSPLWEIEQLDTSAAEDPEAWLAIALQQLPPRNRVGSV